MFDHHHRDPFFAPRSASAIQGPSSCNQGGVHVFAIRSGGLQQQQQQQQQSNTMLQHIAGNMCPVPAFMAIFLATLASVPWSYADDGDDMNEHDGH